MTSLEPFRLGAWGFVLEEQLFVDGQPADISGATLLEVRFERPDSTVFHKTATLITTGADGRVGYLVAQGDIDQAGPWRYQFVVDAPSFGFPLEKHTLSIGTNIP